MLLVFPNHPAGFSMTDVEEKDAQPLAKVARGGSTDGVGHRYLTAIQSPFYGAQPMPPSPQPPNSRKNKQMCTYCSYSRSRICKRQCIDRIR